MHTPLKVVHNYVDRASEPDPVMTTTTAATAATTGTGNNHHNNNNNRSNNQQQHQPEQNFPRKLHYMLTSVEGDGQSHIVSWQPHGR